MSAQETQKKIAAALSRDDGLSLAECKSLLLEVAGAIENASERMNRTRPGDARHEAGAERLQALRTGSAEDVRKVNLEYEESKILVDQILAQRDELHRRRTAAQLREAKENMPKLHADLVAKLDAAEAAKQALKRALAAVNAAAGEITSARGTIRAQTLSEPDGGASVRTLQRLDSLQSAFTMDQLGARHPHDWTALLGCAVTERVYKDAKIKVPDADYSECESDAAVMRMAVETLFGPRDQDDAEVAKAFSMLPAHAKERMVA